GATNPHIRTDLPTPVAQAGSYISGAINWVTRDIDSRLRDVTSPDIGADEGSFQVLTPNDMAAGSFVDPADGGSKNVSASFAPQATFSNVGTGAVTNVPVRYRIKGPLPATTVVYDQVISIASLAAGASQTVTFPSLSIAQSGPYQIEAVAQLGGDQNGSNDTKVGALDIIGPLNGTYSVGEGQPAPFTTLTGAVQA